jgi:hypothetical protein
MRLKNNLSLNEEDETVYTQADAKARNVLRSRFELMCRPEWRTPRRGKTVIAVTLAFSHGLPEDVRCP